MNQDQIRELVLQSVEHERGSVKVYRAALQCVLNPDLREEWQKHLQQSHHHERILMQLCESIGLDPDQETPGREAIRLLNAALVSAMQTTLIHGKPEAAELVACESVLMSETKDHLDWQLIGRYADQYDGEIAKAMKAAHAQVVDDEDAHFYHSKGWCRELWKASLGMKAMLPPPEVRHHFSTLIGAAQTG